jgi:Tfp pilus assembly protein PilN
VLQRSLQRQLADELFDAEQTQLYRWSLANGHAPEIPMLGEVNLVEMAKGRLATGESEFAPATPAILPAVGAALGAVREGVVRLNLLPTEQREAFDEGPSITTWVLLALSMVLLLTWGAMAIIKDGMLRRDVRASLAAIEPDVNEVMGLQEEIDRLQRQVEILGAQDGRVTTMLKDLTELIPADAYLTTLNLRGGRLTLDGQARSASDILTALERSKRVKNPTFSSPTTRQGDKERFAITAEVPK